MFQTPIFFLKIFQTPIFFSEKISDPHIFSENISDPHNLSSDRVPGVKKDQPQVNTVLSTQLQNDI